ncbi:MAG: acetate--CoA ligase family protein [Planctomycetes bacterium]|jgi:acetyltransferase|nr:acetate--CoA ligase family protein [Planctomycetota bacterium]
MSLNTFFHPKSIAIIGASNDHKKIGWQLIDNLKASKFKGKIYPINLKEKKIAGLSASSSIEAVRGKIDLVVMAIPAPFVVLEVEKCAKKKIKDIIIISAGFSETSPEGKKLEEQIKELAKKNKMNILGPNCLGMINNICQMDATFARTIKGKEIKKEHNIAFVSQSGAIGSAVLDWASNRNVGFSYFISLGNKAVLDENDFFDYFVTDKNTDLVVAYLEEIKHGERFMAAVSKLARIKPVAILKAGKTQAGSSAAMSHTGSMAGSSQAILTGLKRSGAIILDNMNQLFNLMRLIKKQLVLKNSDVYVVSNAGGPLVLTADEISQNDLSFGEFSAKTQKEIAAALPPLTHVKNPLDVLGDAPADRYQKSLAALLRDNNVYSVLILLTPQTTTEPEKTAELIGKLAKQYPDKLIITSFIGGGALSEAKKILAKYLIPNFDYPEEAVKALAQFLNYKKNLKDLSVYRATEKSALTVTTNAWDEQLDYLKSFTCLKEYNIPVADTRAIREKKDLAGLKYPIVLKITGPDFIHKTDKKAIYLNVKNEQEAWSYIEARKAELKNQNYFVAQPMLSGDLQLILGFKRDNSFGPILMVGLGGIYAEIFKEVELEVDDLNETRALAMIKRAKFYKILAGARGQAAYDIRGLVMLLVNFARLARERKEIKELDINPLLINRDGFTALDVRIIV